MEAAPVGLLASLGTALLAGVIVGLERQIAGGKARTERGQPVVIDVGGVRTFPLIALVGALATVVGVAFLPVVGLLALVALMAAHHLGKPVEARRDAGLTTETAAVATYLLGVLSSTPSLFAGDAARVTEVTACAVVIALILSVKSQLHELTEKVSAAELLAALQLLVVAVVFLPLVPDQGFGPYDAVNPAQVGRMVVFIGGIGFVGFIATRFLGAGHGLVVTGLVGGLASSTAVTFAMARRAKENPALVCSCALAIVGASCVMLVRVLVAATLLFPPLGPRMGGALVVMFAVSLAAAWPLVRGARAESKASAAVDVTNPFELKSAFIFGLAFALVILLSKFLRDTFGDSALYVAALVAGLTDVDAITLSTANLAKDGLGLAFATGVILTACLSNTFVKIVIGWSTGGAALGKQLARVFGAMLAAGVAAVVVTLVF